MVNGQQIYKIKLIDPGIAFIFDFHDINTYGNSYTSQFFDLHFINKKLCKQRICKSDIIKSELFTLARTI